jgi:hypothetical protein
VAAEAHAADGVALAVQVLAQPAHLLGRAGEAVRHQAAGSGGFPFPGKEIRFGSWNDLRHGWIITRTIYFP